MKTAYYSVFYQLLRFTFWVRTRDTQQWTALLCFTLLQYLNVATLYSMAAHYWYPYGHRVPVSSAVVVFGLLVFCNYYLLRDNPLYRDPTTIHQQKHRGSTAWLVGGYVVLSGLLGAYYLKQLHDVNVLFRQ